MFVQPEPTYEEKKKQDENRFHLGNIDDFFFLIWKYTKERKERKKNYYLQNKLDQSLCNTKITKHGIYDARIASQLSALILIDMHWIG